MIKDGELLPMTLDASSTHELKANSAGSIARRGMLPLSVCLSVAIQ